MSFQDNNWQPSKHLYSDFEGFQNSNSQLSQSFLRNLGDTGKQLKPNRVRLNYSKQDQEKYNKKVIENCRRTARIIIISELTEIISKKTHLMDDLKLILSQYKSSSSKGKNAHLNYFSSLNFGRIKICHRQFIKKIISKDQFQPILLTLLQDKDKLLQSKQIRKNKRAAHTLEQRKKIIRSAFEEYQNIILNGENNEGSLPAVKNQFVKIEDNFQRQIKKFEAQHEKINSLYLTFPYCYCPTINFSHLLIENPMSIYAQHDYFWINNDCGSQQKTGNSTQN